MKSPGLRRAVTIIVFFLWLAGLWLFLKSREPVHAVKDTLQYKVRAYITTREKARRTLAAGKEMGYKGSMTKGVRNINKFMGYIVVQDFYGTATRENTKRITDFLKSKGYQPQIETDEKKQRVSIQVGGYYPDEKYALHIADDARKLTTVAFTVRKHVKKVSYRAFVTVFPGVKNKEDAQILHDKLKEFTSDVETITY